MLMYMETATKDKAISRKPGGDASTTVLADSLHHIISKGVSSGASDIHIEPREQFIWVRYRVGNALQLGTKLPLTHLAGLMAVAKKLSGLSVSERDVLQEGNFNLTINNQDHVVHLSVIPVLGGEKMVIHLSPISSKLVSLEDIGFWGENLKLINSVVSKLRGVILVASSDRNSGVLTTHGILNMLVHPTVKLAALGDPTIDNAHEAIRGRVDASKGMTPQRSLKRIIGRDPNVILISDLVDKDTATTAFEGGKTKLVCINTQAKDAISLLQRLSNTGVDPLLLASTMSLAISQTIVRKLCTSCRESYAPPLSLVRELDSLLEDFSESDINKLERRALESGLGADISSLGSTPKQINRLWRPSSGGCEHCQYSGYHDYTTLNEVLNTKAPKIQSYLIKPSIRSANIRAHAIKEKMLPKYVDGLIKCLRGIVSIDDVLLVAKTSGYA
jgi:type II secretory ATPase GspE/PulE/Tfp pilus assembly ATPase PilB-like protein